MKPLAPNVLTALTHDFDSREELLRQVVEDRLAEKPAATSDDHLVASYFFAFRTMTLAKSVKEIAYHATSGTKHPPRGSLIEQCTAIELGVDPFDSTGRVGLLHIGFPLKMLLAPDGHMTSIDILHTAANAIIFDVYENQDARLLRLKMPDRVIRTFPGPRYGPEGLRQRTGFAPDQPAFGTILKPTAGITPDMVGSMVEQAARCPLFLFVKEDENLYPNLDYSPVCERVKQAVAAIKRVKSAGGPGLLFAPHITGTPHEFRATVEAIVEAGATAMMFSETFNGGAVRMVREMTKHMENPPAIYGHNAGIGVKTRSVWREVIDQLARLDGIDFRQTAPVRTGSPFIKPYGREWEASEKALSEPLPGIKPTMIVRAGGLDQGNIAMNLADAQRRGIDRGVLFLAGSAINSVTNAKGEADPAIGAEAMMQAVDAHRAGVLDGVPIENQAETLKAHARKQKLTSLTAALDQRYPAGGGSH